ncbi:MAG TPA: AAC(3) family N-acetyltransferase [Thermoplasmata archaeon]|nr:AAC(3) family N-acetyltransferase [Thermoplasmata archaeon]
MTESEVIARTSGGPVTQRGIEADLRHLGLASGQIVLVHASLSRLGWVVGGGHSVLLALEGILGPTGTLLMPSFSDGVPEPSRWENPPVPESWWATIRKEVPAWDPGASPTRQMGVIADSFRHQVGTRQSFHPNKSFVARGPHATALLSEQSLDDGFGERSPLGRLYDLDGNILLLGVSHENNTSLHLAEYRAEWPGRATRLQFTGRVVREGRIEPVSFSDIDGTSADFEQLGREYEQAGGEVTRGAVGRGEGRLLRMRPMVDFAVSWISRNRATPPPGSDHRPPPSP